MHLPMSLTSANGKETQHWQLGRGQTPSITTTLKHGSTHWTKAIWRCTTVQPPDWRRSTTKTHSTISMRNQSDMPDIRPNSTRSGSFCNVANPGSLANTSGSRAEVVANATHAKQGPTKVSPWRPLRPRLQKDCDQLTHEAPHQHHSQPARSSNNAQ